MTAETPDEYLEYLEAERDLVEELNLEAELRKRPTKETD